MVPFHTIVAPTLIAYSLSPKTYRPIDRKILGTTYLFLSFYTKQGQGPVSLAPSTKGIH